MLDACATNQTSKPMYVSDVSLELPWEQDFFDWLSSKTFHEQDCKTGKTSSYEQYRFSGKNGLELDTSEVINHMLTYGKRLSPGRPLRGLLLATGGLMPQDLFHGGLIDAVLVMTTTDGAEHRGQIRLWTDRPGRTKKEAETENRLSPTFNCVMSIVLSEWADWLDGGDSLSRKT